jgi:hypothetical protein
MNTKMNLQFAIPEREVLPAPNPTLFNRFRRRMNAPGRCSRT